MDDLTDYWSSLIKKYSTNLFDNQKNKRIPEWNQVLSKLPKLINPTVTLDKEVSVKGEWTDNNKELARNLLMQLLPWRKGPFLIEGINIDSEWKSNMKWERFLTLNLDLRDKRILDVGSGNGYYGFRMLGEGAKYVICLEPNLNHCVQFLSINQYVASDSIKIIPERIESLDSTEGSFDVIFSMGLLYHQRNPLEHIRSLSTHLNKKGIIVLETIIAPSSYGKVLIPDGRYANMPNVWNLHTDQGFKELVGSQGFKILKSSEKVLTTTKEQRSTDWMPFKSFDTAIRSDNDELTVEDLPSPERKFFILQK